jgi:hypothetical protein
VGEGGEGQEQGGMWEVPDRDKTEERDMFCNTS